MITTGNDIIYLPNFKDSLNESFIRRVYTKEEIEYCEQFNDPMLRYASTFAAKEAVYKAMKQWDPSLLLPWKKIKIYRDKIAGAPKVILEGSRYAELDFTLSITHDGDYVWALTICESDFNYPAQDILKLYFSKTGS